MYSGRVARSHACERHSRAKCSEMLDVIVGIIVSVLYLIVSDIKVNLVAFVCKVRVIVV